MSATNLARTLLVFGATGNAGKRCVQAALLKDWKVVAFVRQPAKVSEVFGATVAEKLTVVQGDLNDSAAVASVVKSARPDALIDASSAIPFGHKKGQPANSADRRICFDAVLEALRDSGRLADCRVIIIGGQLLPEPGGNISSTSVWMLAMLLKHVVARSMFAGAEKAIQQLWNSPPALRFIMARMGRMVDEPSMGVLAPEGTVNNIQHGPASYTDVGTALVELAGDTSGAWDRKALYFNYRK